MFPPDAALLRALRNSARPLLPSELAEAAGLELGEVNARLDELVAAGFGIERHPSLGCSLVSSPEHLIADDLWSRMDSAAGGLIREIVVLAETGSTNDVAMRLGREGVAGGVLVIAEKQTSGRGRFGRKWESASGRGVWMSLLLEPALAFEQWARLTTWMAVSAAAAMEAVAPVRCGIKWPNDVQIAGRKVAGMLMEIGTRECDQRPFVVAGLGINANHEEGDFPGELREIATSLRAAAGGAIDRAVLMVRLIAELERRWTLLEDGFAGVVREATERSTVLGRWICVQGPEGMIEGEAAALDAEGHLLLRMSDGETRTLFAGEVSLRGA
jgi:BirA family biotin operon repressor/biotin-[acetyl-CoA-carboxylase] ligase